MIKKWQERCREHPTIADQLIAMEEEIKELRALFQTAGTYVPEIQTKEEQLAYTAGWYQGMANFAKDLKDDPKRSLEFFRNAGILDEAGNLTKFYQGGNKE
jgi:hypothetical protein